MTPETYFNNRDVYDLTIQLAFASVIDYIDPNRVGNIHFISAGPPQKPPGSPSAVTAHSEHSEHYEHYEHYERSHFMHAEHSTATATSAERRSLRRRLRTSVRPHAASDRAVLVCRIVSFDPDYSYEDRESQLLRAYDIGLLTSQMRGFAQAFGASRLQHANASRPITRNTLLVPKPKEEPTELNNVVIVGICIGTMFVLVLLYGVFRFIQRQIYGEKLNAH